jgi:hypothetical protein
MDTSQLPDVSDVLVTAGNPARTNLSGMDHARCAALHNYLVHYAWVAEGRDPARLHRIANNSTYFNAYGQAAETIRPRLHLTLAKFLQCALVPPPVNRYNPSTFFFWASQVPEPQDIFDPNSDFIIDVYDQPAESVLLLYHYNCGHTGAAGAGLFYHQRHHRAAFFMTMDDYDFALPVEEHPELWHPLETVLSNWIDLISIGKVIASPTDTPSLFGSQKVGPWEWVTYSEAQVAACVAAWDRLCDAIEARYVLLLPPDSATTVKWEPLLTSDALMAASVREPSFAWSFLTRARRPQFRYIAPGLLLPPAEGSEFAAVQPFTRLPRPAEVIPPVCLFTTVRGECQVDLTTSSNPFCQEFQAYSNDSPAIPTRIPVGVYANAVHRVDHDNAEEAFYLFLPFGLKGGLEFGDVKEANEGARTSDGSFVNRGSTFGLFQHGFKPFGGDTHRPQRLERLFDTWRKLVEDGIWAVGLEGVEGTIDTFREAETTLWKHYVIPPSW